MQTVTTKEQIEKVLKKYPGGRENIIKCLHELQNSNPQNYLSKDALDATAKHFNLSKGQIFGIVSYYSMFSLKPRGRNLIRLCKSPVCSMLGSKSISGLIFDKTGLKPGDTSADGGITFELAECLGRCGKAPSMMVNAEFYTGLNEEKIDEILQKLK